MAAQGSSPVAHLNLHTFLPSSSVTIYGRDFALCRRKLRSIMASLLVWYNEKRVGEPIFADKNSFHLFITHSWDHQVFFTGALHPTFHWPRLAISAFSHSLELVQLLGPFQSHVICLLAYRPHKALSISSSSWWRFLGLGFSHLRIQSQQYGA